MKFTTKHFLTVAITATSLTRSILTQAKANDGIIQIDSSFYQHSKASISLPQFQDLLLTEIHDEVHSLDQQAVNARKLEQQEDIVASMDTSLSPAQAMWDDVINHGWNSFQDQERQTQSSTGSSQRRLGESSNAQDTTSEATITFPFLVCSRSDQFKSGSQRLKPMIEATGAHKQDVIVVYNDQEQTCYHISTSFENGAQLKAQAEENSGYTIVPMTDIMKIAVNTMAEVSEAYWAPSSTIPMFDDADADDDADDDTDDDTDADEDDDSWERMIRVSFVTGDRASFTKEEEVLSQASTIINFVQRLGSQGSQSTQRKLHQQQDSNQSQSRTSVSDAFSLTTSTSNSRRLQSSLGRNQFWQHSLERGLESDHGCQTMFDTMETRAQYDLKGFDIILNPTDTDKATEDEDEVEVKSSASNVHCITSLIMALSVHPSVLHIEVDTPITADDIESQWITQSKILGYRPLTNVGLTGKNQIVSVIDSGCQVDHRYFGPTNNVFGRWDMNQRKIVKYSTIRGDQRDVTGGHGTYVAGVVAGYTRSGDNEAVGVAPDAKLHIIDVSKGNADQMISPSPQEILRSMYNNGNGAKIANGSWSTKYKAYPTSCRFFDNELYDHQDVLYVASAGNTGRTKNMNASQMKTVGNPAACKNTLAVGASQSDGDRIEQEDMGSDFLAMFSSRGPTADDRMKPDIVAPGYNIMAPHAHPQFGESDKKEKSGTSFAAPVVAGNAALVRQYFEEGWFNCGRKGCNDPIKPSGSLVKAVLMNGATDLSGIQAVLPHAEVVEPVEPYDNNQGMGLINMVRSLPIQGHNRFKALMQNNEPITDGDKHTFFVKARLGAQYQSPSLSMTLAWYDKGGANSCAKCLLNDLDVWAQELTWNGNVRRGTKKFANDLSTQDTRNNVERIRFDMSNGKIYRITVRATNLIEDEIKYSLFATGCFKNVPDPKTLV